MSLKEVVKWYGSLAIHECIAAKTARGMTEADARRACEREGVNSARPKSKPFGTQLAGRGIKIQEQCECGKHGWHEVK